MVFPSVNGRTRFCPIMTGYVLSCQRPESSRESTKTRRRSIPRLFASRPPSGFHIRGSVLSILDDKGRELWRYDTGLENLVDEAGYRTYIQYRRIVPETWAGRMPHLVIKDIAADGSAEVLFSTQTQDELSEGKLICFGPRGKVRWRLRTGREMRFGEGVAAMEVLNDNRISAVTFHTGLYYEFSFDLRTVRVLTSHRFEQIHDRAAADFRPLVRGQGLFPLAMAMSTSSALGSSHSPSQKMAFLRTWGLGWVLAIRMSGSTP